MNKAKHNNLPTPPSLWATLGPSFILLGLALGSGELILWPYLAAKWGLGLMWGAFLGITFQYVLNTETMRYSLAWGESVFVGLKKLGKWFPLWFIISTFIPWGLPGFSSATAQILARLFNFPNETLLAILLLLIVGIILSLGKVLYRTMEIVQRSVILVGLPLITFLVIVFTKRADWVELGWGLIGQGNGWWFFPSGVSIAAFLGAFAYSGAGGNLNLAQSYYVKEKGLGMGRYAAKITSLFQKEQKQVQLEGQTFVLTQENKTKWQQWWKLVNWEHFIVFWCLGFLTIILLSVLAKTLVFGSIMAEGIEFIYQESEVIKTGLSSGFALTFLLVAALMLYSTQLGVLESSSRIIGENTLLLLSRTGRKVNASLAFYVALWGQIFLGIVILLLGIKEPRLLLTLSAILNAVAMTVAFPLIYWLNYKQLPAFLQPSLIRRILIIIAIVFFFVFTTLTVSAYF